jgi:hypothetical protein
VFDLVELQADAGIEPGVRDMAAYKAFVVFIIGVVDWDEIGLNSRAADLTSILFDRHALALHGTPGLTPRGGAVLRDRIVAIAGEDGLRCTIGYAALARLGITCRRRQPPVQPVRPLGEVHDVSGRKLLLALRSADARRPAEDEEHLLDAVMHVQVTSRRSRQKLCQDPVMVVLFIPGLVFQEVQAAHPFPPSRLGICEEIMPLRASLLSPEAAQSPWLQRAGSRP